MVHILKNQPIIPPSQSGYRARILGLPLEIQSEIFTHAHYYVSDEGGLLLPVEVILSHVCSDWRNIAINLPFLWTAFKFDSRRRASVPIHKLKEYLLRSRTQLLELHFDVSIFDYEEWDECYHEPFVQSVEIAVAHAGRWRRFTLFTSPTLAKFEFIKWLEHISAPNLEYFAVCLGSEELLEGTEDPRDINPSVLIDGAPKLSVIRIDTTSHFHSLPPLSNVTTLTIQDSPGIIDNLYSLRTFRSILMIPALTNLSIETTMSLDSLQSLGDPTTLPRISMPSLKVLRITGDREILGILSVLDAPLLETLVLHMLDLKSLYIGQDVDKITPFKNLDTISLLNVSYDRDEEEPEHGYSLALVIMILNKLACCATHIVISSYSGLSWSGADLFDFGEHKWPRLKCVTLGVSSESDIMSLAKNIARSPHSLTIRVVETLLAHCRASHCDALTRLEKVCKLEGMKAGALMMDEYWPAPGGIFHEDGNLVTSDWKQCTRLLGLWP
ncbi:hypothetical protein M413DRAFT_246892 [Hebeloma cylindrosporum]|uniref:Uncharacterized protein n=1 Tax=Hebeloma cylindrosporum TaxID=76867 RepID=A0A0C3C3J7_HEBCY|nr:hypothetical protein M413DRAFT_246892 [Hebeloma cylindrosporum h7]